MWRRGMLAGTASCWGMLSPPADIEQGCKTKAGLGRLLKWWGAARLMHATTCTSASRLAAMAGLPLQQRRRDFEAQRVHCPCLLAYLACCSRTVACFEVVHCDLDLEAAHSGILPFTAKWLMHQRNLAASCCHLCLGLDEICGSSALRLPLASASCGIAAVTDERSTLTSCSL